MIQLSLQIEGSTATPTPCGPGLDATTVKQLKAAGFTYLGTHWSVYFKEWHHDIRVITPRSTYRIWKTDQGVAALLRQGKVPA